MAARTCRFLEKVLQFPRLTGTARIPVSNFNIRLAGSIKDGHGRTLVRSLCSVKWPKPDLKEGVNLTEKDVESSKGSKVTRKRKTGLNRSKKKVEKKGYGGIFQYDNNDNSTVVMARELLEDVKSTFDEPNARRVERECMAEIGSEIDGLVTTSSSLLGLTADELKTRYQFLTTYHVEPVFALRIALSFPSLLIMDAPKVGRVLGLFRRYGIDVQQFLTNPVLLSLDPDTVEKNVDQMLKSGLNVEAVSDLASSYPLCLAFPLNKKATDTMKTFSQSGSRESSSFLSRLLRDSFNFVSVKFKQNPRYQEGAQFLEQVGIPVNIILGKYPEFFNQSGEHLWRCFDYLCGKPLYFDMESLREYVAKNPDVFVLLNEETVRDLVNTTEEIFKDGNRLLTLFIRRPKLFTNPELVLDKIALFRRWNFTDKDLCKLLVSSHTAFLKERGLLEERFNFLLTDGDIKTRDVAKHGMMLTLGMPLMKSRIGFLREKNISALQERETSDIFWTDDATFATEICKSTAEEFEAHVQKHLHFQRRNESVKKRQKKRALKEASGVEARNSTEIAAD